MVRATEESWAWATADRLITGKYQIGASAQIAAKALALGATRRNGSRHPAIERLREFHAAFAQEPVYLFGGCRLSATLSMGIAAFPADGPVESELLERADQRLYGCRDGPARWKRPGSISAAITRLRSPKALARLRRGVRILPDARATAISGA